MKIDIALPSGSLWNQLKEFLFKAGYPIGDPNGQGICGETECFRFFRVDRRSVPKFIDRGGFAAGITGYDLYLDSGVDDQEVLAELPFSRRTLQPTRWVLASLEGWNPQNPVRIVTELPRLAARLLEEANVPFEYTIERIDGTEELWITHDMADNALVVTETGSSLKRHKLAIVPGFDSLLVSQPCIFSSSNVDEESKKLLKDFAFALASVVEAYHHVMVTFNIEEVNYRKLEKSLISETAPTVTSMMKNGWVAVETCIPRTEYGRIGRMIKEHDGCAIVMQDVDGFSS